MTTGDNRETGCSVVPPPYRGDNQTTDDRTTKEMGHWMMKEDVVELKTRVDLAALVEDDLGPAHKRYGRWWMWPCPFHDDRTPSLAVRPDTGSWHCFGCSESGDHITWLEKREDLSFTEALDTLAGLAGVALAPSPPKRRLTKVDSVPSASWQERAQAVVADCEQMLWEDEGSKARTWLHRRGLTDESLRRWRLGYNRTDRKLCDLWVPQGITIPCFVDGTLWYIKVRRPVPPLKGPKYQQVKGSRPALFGLDHLAGKSEVVICEGELDAILLQQKAGDLVDVVAVGSATNRPSLRFLLRLVRYPRWLVAFDRDDAGEKGADWWGDFSDRVRRVRPLQGNDLTDFHQAGGDLRAWVTFYLARPRVESSKQATQMPEPAPMPISVPQPSQESHSEVISISDLADYKRKHGLRVVDSTWDGKGPVTVICEED